jgi:chemotaxis protein histidine kinase CheA
MEEIINLSLELWMREALGRDDWMLSERSPLDSRPVPTEKVDELLELGWIRRTDEPGKLLPWRVVMTERGLFALDGYIKRQRVAETEAFHAAERESQKAAANKAKQKTDKKKHTSQSQQMETRNEQIHRRRREGETYVSLSKAFNLTRGRIKQIYEKLERLRERKERVELLERRRHFGPPHGIEDPEYFTQPYKGTWFGSLPDGHPDKDAAVCFDDPPTFDAWWKK